MSDEVLTVTEIATALKGAEETVYAMAQAEQIPAFEIRGQWRIERAELDPWIDAQPRAMVQRIKKRPRDYRAHANSITRAWSTVRGRCAEAERFSVDVAAVVL